MNLENIAYYTIQFRKGCDFVPAVSTVNNIVDLVAKVALDIFDLIDHERHDYVVSFSVIGEMNQKGYVESLLLAIPFLNIYMAYLRYVAASDNSEGPPAPPSRDGSRRMGASMKPKVESTVSDEERKVDEEDSIGGAEGGLSPKVEDALTRVVQGIIRSMCQDEEGREILLEVIEKKESGEEFDLYEYFKEETLKKPKDKKSTPKVKKKKSKGLMGFAKGVVKQGVKVGKEFGKIVLEGLEAGTIAGIDEYLNTEEGREFAKSELAKYEK